MLFCYFPAGNAPLPSPPAFSWVKLQQDSWSDFFTVHLDSITYDGVPLDIPVESFRRGYGTVVDSGTTFLYLEASAYTRFLQAVQEVAASKGLLVGLNFENCVSVLKVCCISAV
jgi:hypothetical protein